MAKTLRRVSVLFAFLSFLSFVLPRIAVAANNPVPLINDPLVPSAVAPGGPTFTLTVNGSNFVAASVVKLNGVALATTFVNSSQLTASVSSSAIATAGSASITVTNPAPRGGISLPAYLRIATPVSTPSFVSYLQGNSFNGFEAGPFLTADFNSDGKLDVAFLVNHQASGTNLASICVALGKGDGSFQSPVCKQAPAGQFLSSLVAADFNGDGKIDIAVSTELTPGNAFAAIYLGNGDGTLGSPINSQTGTGTSTLSVGDFNRDGKLDLAITNLIQGSTNTTFITVALGNGDGTFQAPVTYASGFNAFSLLVADFNRDGNLDLVFNSAAGASPTTVYFMLGNSDGTFQSPQAGQVIDEFDVVTSAVDINGDGKLDLLLYDNTKAANSVLLGNGDGTFQTESPISPSSSSIGSVSRYATVDDLNADGNLDLSFCIGNASGDNKVRFLLGNGNGTFGSVADLPTPQPYLAYPSAIISGDFNGDGRVDILVDMTYLGGPAAFLVYLQGSSPVISPSVAFLNFPQQAVGVASSPQAITLTNGGTISVNLSGITFTGASAASFGQTNTCGASLAGGASCQINVTFSPAIAGSAAAFMNIASTAVNNPSSVYLTGSTQGPAATLSPTSVTFPNQYVGTSGNPQSVTVTNNGTATLNITNVAASPSDFATLNACGSSLAVGASCAIGVFFDPTTGGTRTGTLTITDNAGDPQTVPLTGTGQDFSMSAGSSPSATISAGQTANYTVSLAPAGGFAQTVALTCSGGPTGSNCAVSPTTIALSGTAAQTVKVTVTTPAQGAIPSLIRWRGHRNRPAPLTFALAQFFLVFILVSLLVSFSRLRNQGLRSAPLFAAALVVSMSLALASCGGGSGNSGGGGNSNPESGTYTVNVSGNFSTGSTTLTHNTKLTLVVQ